MLTFLLWVTLASRITGVTIERVDIRASLGHEYVAVLVRNDTDTTIKAIEARVCHAANDCETVYLLGRFVPHAASWSSEFEGHRVDSVTLVRVQSVEVAP